MKYLEILECFLEKDIYFVLGNHDYYYGSIEGVRTEVARLSGGSERLHWLGGRKAVRLTPGAYLVGHGGWGDARLGDYATSGVRLNDFELIHELKRLSKQELETMLNSLGDESAAHLQRALESIPPSPDLKIIVLLHVAPFKETAWYNGRPSGDDWLPFFSCKAAGDVLLRYMTELTNEYPDARMTVLCGHTHGGGTAAVLPNMTVHTGAARYGHPAVQNVAVSI